MWDTLSRSHSLPISTHRGLRCLKLLIPVRCRSSLVSPLVWSQHRARLVVHLRGDCSWISMIFGKPCTKPYFLCFHWDWVTVAMLGVLSFSAEIPITTNIKTFAFLPTPVTIALALEIQKPPCTSSVKIFPCLTWFWRTN